ncbi:MAG TPA: winged helix-turn-helix domain-containing protein, partial [Paraburkholderia sp.]
MIELGRFQIDLEMRTLQQNGETLPLGSRAFDILAAVALANGRLVTKDELMNTVWPDTIVEENNIQVHLSALRKVLGQDRDLILTVPGRGYQLRQRQKNTSSCEAGARTPGFRRLPPPKSGLLGRSEAVRKIRAMLEQTHVLTLVGAGGIGKTSVAIEAAHHSAADFAEPACFVDLAVVTTEEAVLRAIVESCELPLHGPQVSAGQVAAALARQHRLLLLDNAEHVIGAVAHIVEVLIAG